MMLAPSGAPVEITAGSASYLDWALASRTPGDGGESGDRLLVEERAGRCVVALANGVGHGSAAAVVADTVVRTIREQPATDVTALLVGCHAAIQGTRGAAVSLGVVQVRERRLAWAALGNLPGILVRGPTAAGAPVEHLLPQPGILGVDPPTRRPVVVAIDRGDTLLVSPVGVVRAVSPEMVAQATPRRIAELLVRVALAHAPTARVLAVRVRW